MAKVTVKGTVKRAYNKNLTETLQIRVSPRHRQILEQHAHNEDTSLSELLRLAIESLADTLQTRSKQQPKHIIRPRIAPQPQTTSERVNQTMIDKGLASATPPRKLKPGLRNYPGYTRQYEDES